MSDTQIEFLPTQAWSLHLKERYNAGACDTLSDISPCNWPGAGGRAAAGEHRSWRDYQLSWPRAAAGPTPQGSKVPLHICFALFCHASAVCQSAVGPTSLFFFMQGGSSASLVPSWLELE